MKKHPLRLMGMLGLVGVAGLLTGNYGLFGFFGFFGFFALAREKDDEMLRQNMAKAGFNAFLVSLVGFPGSRDCGHFHRDRGRNFRLFYHVFCCPFCSPDPHLCFFL